MTRLQIVLASLDAFVIVAGASVAGNLLAGWISRWWAAGCAKRADRRLAKHVGPRCEHGRRLSLCDDCNADQWAKRYLGNETKKGG